MHYIYIDRCAMLIKWLTMGNRGSEGALQYNKYFYIYKARLNKIITIIIIIIINNNIDWYYEWLIIIHGDIINICKHSMVKIDYAYICVDLCMRNKLFFVLNRFDCVRILRGKSLCWFLILQSINWFWIGISIKSVM